MKKIDAGSLKKMGIALLIAVILIAVAAIAAQGRENETEEPAKTSDAVQKDGMPDSKKENKESEDAEDEEEIIPQAVVPAFLNPITGLETTEELAYAEKYAVIADSSAPLYGISCSDLCMEIPVEDGKTRMLFFPRDLSILGKVGALAKSRSYLETAVHFFGGIPVYYGTDDIITSYPSYLCRATMNLSECGSCYMENARYTYTSGESVKSVAKLLELESGNDEITLPYEWNGYFAEEICGNSKALSVTLPYCGDGETKFTYDPDSSVYVLSKGGKIKKDPLTGKECDFRNIIVLFADETVYSKSSGKECVVDVISGGCGYYLSGGTFTEIRWSTDQNGNLIFSRLTGEKLIINRGNIYIGYFSSADSYSVTIE